MKITPIQTFIHLFRKQQVKGQMYRGLCQLSIGSILLLLILGIMESIFYFTISIRSDLMEIFLFLFTTLLTYILLRVYLHTKSIFNNSSNYALATQFKHRDPQIGDRLLNALQLEETIDEIDTGRDMAEYAIHKINSKLEHIPISALYDPVSNKKNNGIK